MSIRCSVCVCSHWHCVPHRQTKRGSSRRRSGPAQNGTLATRSTPALQELGYIEGKSIQWKAQIQVGSTSLADELVRMKVDLIVALTTPATKAAMQATTRLPVVFESGDPIAMGFAESLAKPGKNGTGLSLIAGPLTAKRVELLKQVVPTAQRIGYLRNPTNPLDRADVRRSAEGCQRVACHARQRCLSSTKGLGSATASYSTTPNGCAGHGRGFGIH